MDWCRKSDGSSFFGSISYPTGNNLTRFTINADGDVLIAYNDLVLESLSLISDIDKIYKFLYGYTEKELENLIATKPSHASLEIKQHDNITSTDFEMVFSAFLVFVNSKCSFKSEYWNALKKLLTLVNMQNFSFWEQVALNKNVNADILLKWFNNFVFFELSKRLELYLNEESCYTCYIILCEIRDVLLPFQYDIIEEKCCELFDQIALKRINTNTEGSFKYGELETFSVDVFFFYTEYFKLKHSNPKTKLYVYERAFEIYISLAQALIEKNKYYLANRFLCEAENCATNPLLHKKVIAIKETIAPQIKEIEREKEKEQAKAEKAEKRLRARGKRKSTKIIAVLEDFLSKYIGIAFKVSLIILVAAVLLSVVGLIISNHLLFSVSWKIALGSIIVFLAYSIFLFVLGAINHF